MRYLLPLVLMLALLSVAAVPAAAQNTDAALLEDLQTAIAQFRTLDSYRLSADNDIQQNIALTMQNQPTSVEQHIAQTIDGVFVNDDGAPRLQASIDQQIDSSALGARGLQQTIDMIIVDEDFYVRFSGSLGAGTEGMFPDDWVNVADARGDYSGLQFLSSEQYTHMLGDQFAFTLTDEMVTEIEALPNVTLDSGEARVIRVTLDGDAILNSDAAESFLGATGFDQMMQQLGGDLEDIVNDLFDDAVLEYTYYIDEADGLIHQVDAHIEMNAKFTMMGSNITLDQVVDGTNLISDFNEEFDIQAPETA